jgi:hypothetical protein
LRKRDRPMTGVKVLLPVIGGRAGSAGRRLHHRIAPV